MDKQASDEGRAALVEVRKRKGTYISVAHVDALDKQGTSRAPPLRSLRKGKLQLCVRDHFERVIVGRPDRGIKVQDGFTLETCSTDVQLT